ncbi:MAG TPA: hypothetical protein VFS24_16500 [Steroidobacteraceae bacterium]|nr:hypothetical protein [Steroidobacteraceae bacterium]
MTTVLFASEGSATFSEHRAQLTLAQRLLRLGHRLVFARAEIESGHQTFAQLGWVMLPAPRSLEAETRAKHPSTYAQALQQLGFDDGRTLTAHVEAWRHLFAAARIDVLVADHAPTALLAASICELPSVAIGNPFTVPAADSATLAAGAATNTGSDRNGAFPLERMNEVLVNHGRRALQDPADLFRDIPVLLTTFRQLDVARNQTPTYVGPIGQRDVSDSTRWMPQNSRPRVLAQVSRRTPNLRSIFQQLQAIQGDVICFVPDACDLEPSRLEHFRLVPNQSAPTSLIQEASVVVGNGETDLVAQAAIASIPQVKVPIHAHEHLNSKLANERGISVAVEMKREPAAFGKAMQEAIKNPRYRTSAVELAADCARFHADTMIEFAVGIIERCRGGKPGKLGAKVGN